MSNIIKEDEGGNKTEFKFAEKREQIVIVELAVQAVLDSFSKIDASKADVREAEGGQLSTLQMALRDFPEPVTEEVWDQMFKVSVTDLLANAEANGAPRYANRASRNAMVSLFKIATMGLTLAKLDRAFAPTDETAGNLKKYADATRPKLKAAIDPATGKPRLRSTSAQGRQKAPKKLAEGAFYWLIGCGDAEKGIVGANTVIGPGKSLSELEGAARSDKLKGKFKSFLYCEGKLEPLPMEALEEEFESVIQNTTVMYSSFDGS